MDFIALEHIFASTLNKAIRTGRQQTLSIRNVDTYDIPRIPDCVESIEFGFSKRLEKLRHYIGGNNLGSIMAFPPKLKHFYSWSCLRTLPDLPPTMQELDTAWCFLNRLPELPEGLQVLIVPRNNIAEFPEFPSTLKILNCSENPVQHLPALPACLETFSCSRMYKATVLPALPAGLKFLQVSHMNLKELPELPDGLICLACYGCGLESLPPLPTSLEYLYCEKNRLARLPPLPAGLKELRCYGNPFTDLPRDLPSGLSLQSAYMYEGSPNTLSIKMNGKEYKDVFMPPRLV